MVETNNTDPDQTTTASKEAVWLGSFLFAALICNLFILALITNISFDNRKRKGARNNFRIFYLPYLDHRLDIKQKISAQNCKYFLTNNF